MYPTSITTGVEAQYAKKPVDINWPYTVNSVGAFIYDGASIDLQNFELHASEETDLVIKILAMSGIILKDPGLYQIGSAEDVKDIQQEKS